MEEIMDLMFGNSRYTGGENMDIDLLILIVAGLFDAVWRARNLFLHKGYCDTKAVVLGWEEFVNEHSTLFDDRKQMRDVQKERWLVGRGVENVAWRPAGPRIITVNVDAALGNETRGMALAARDHRGQLIILKSALADSISPEEAEIKTLLWATDHALTKNWGRVEWRSDAQRVVHQIMGNEEPGIWNTRNDILQLRETFKRGGWSLIWHPREQNRLADAAAKLTVRFNRPFCCYDFSLDYIHLSLRDICMAEELHAP